MIEVRRITGDVIACTSDVSKHAQLRTPAVLAVTIGDAHARLCEECARDTFNALGFVICSITGESVSQLAGVTKRRSKRGPRR